MTRLVLIDGNAILHRAYHALPPMSNDKGEPTNAIYGFVSMLLRVISDLKPTHIAVAFDRPKPTFRKKLFKNYQAQRPEMEESLVNQVKRVHEVLKAMKIAVFEKDGFEADDVIATLAEQVHSSQFTVRSKKIDEVIIVSGDRDLLQLVNDQVKLYMPVKGLSESKLFGEKETEERMGVKPQQIPDFKALAGDPSDNYRGVDGIGPKTAINLLKEFGDLETVYMKLNKISIPGLIEKLKKDKDNALLSQKLATVVTNVPIEFNQDEAQLTDLLTKQVIDVFGSLGFRTLLRRLSEMSKKSTQKTDKSSLQAKKEEKQMGLF